MAANLIFLNPFCIKTKRIRPAAESDIKKQDTTASCFYLFLMRQSLSLGAGSRLDHLRHHFLRLSHRRGWFFERMSEHFVNPFNRNDFNALFDIIRNFGQIFDVFMRNQPVGRNK